jgi:hypothetical protein
LDVPEGGFDALMQAIVCEEQIGKLDSMKYGIGKYFS